MTRLRILTAALAFAAAPLFAQAHVSASPGAAPANAYAAVAFRVGHGCGGGAATTALRIELPEGLGSARPQPKTGWTLAIERDGDRVAAVTWTGSLPDEQFDDFSLLLNLPKVPGVLYFPALQSCGDVQSQWTEVPDAPGEALSRPAPALRVTAP
jgi:uncharacterized protein YcnI